MHPSRWELRAWGVVRRRVRSGTVAMKVTALCHGYCVSSVCHDIAIHACAALSFFQAYLNLFTMDNGFKSDVTVSSLEA